MNRVFLQVGAWSALLAVLAGAFGAHALGPWIDAESMGVFRTAALYHFLHALALFAIGAWEVPPRIESPVHRAAWTLAVGTLLFSGSLYALAITDVRWLGMLTPLGGVTLCAGWFWLAITAGKAAR